MRLSRELLARWLLKRYTVRIRTRGGMYSQIYPFTFGSSLRAKGYIWPYIPPLVLIRIQYTILGELEGTARYTGLLLAPAEGFGLQPWLFFALQAKSGLGLLRDPSLPKRDRSGSSGREYILSMLPTGPVNLWPLWSKHLCRLCESVSWLMPLCISA